MPIKCKICGSDTLHAFDVTVISKHKARYVVCGNCGFLFAENPYWLEEAYSSAIAPSDTGLISRNIAMANILAVLLYFIVGERGHGRYIDFAGGYGMLTRLMRDYGFDYYWHDKYCENLMALGFEYFPEIGPCRAVTAIEVIEHTDNPVQFIDDVLKFGQTETLIFTTVRIPMNPTEVPC